MPTLMVRDVSSEVHQRLKERARDHRRSLNREVITILEEAVAPYRGALPPLVRGGFSLTQDWLDEAKSVGRE